MFAIALDILTALLALSLILCFRRLYLGPDVPNRTVAFDLITLHMVGLVALFAMRHDTPTMLDIVLITAVLGFLGTVLLARYMEQASSEE
jgi:multicomponent Na+:H+ antiporter subunit F